MSYSLIKDKHSSLTAIINNYNGQLISLNDGKDEFMHQGGRDKTDPLRNTEGWPNSDLIMFPIVSASKDNVIKYGPHLYPMDQHGIVRAMRPFIKSDESKIIVKYIYRADTKIDNSLRHKKDPKNPEEMSLPFSFDMEIEYAVDYKLLHTSITVKNISDVAFGYALGKHPAFNSFTDDPKKGRFLDDEDMVIMCSDEFNDDVELNLENLMEISKTGAKVLKNQSCAIYVHKNNRITVNSNLGDIMLWSPSKNLFCMEPITGKAKKGTLVDLSPNGTYKNVLNPGEAKRYNITIDVI
ncbi:TPA: hypothetical protein HA235_06145 [Candidatus Woesearchaeota archaeon]|nr:hypothetical protein [Candidatus Woesearchaeota archaeon]HIH32261.1 hypothetical protein [Candidatus Woesearchaeota archaeon]HIH54781.1 hypothetical protein [Candidatus Woesearchaeota archaeon]HIJ01373.1 hypothetical protein [Candidatus Woesearchaeota archaeon]HIJ14407.1 hypothetical protein [Candidatus Woesearchaeota archaeon]